MVGGCGRGRGAGFFVLVVFSFFSPLFFILHPPFFLKRCQLNAIDIKRLLTN